MCRSTAARMYRNCTDIEVRRNAMEAWAEIDFACTEYRSRHRHCSHRALKESNATSSFVMNIGMYVDSRDDSQRALQWRGSRYADTHPCEAVSCGEIYMVNFLMNAEPFCCDYGAMGERSEEDNIYISTCSILTTSAPVSGAGGDPYCFDRRMQ